MIIDVDIATGTVSVREPEVLTAFSVASATDDESVVGAAMGDAGESADEPGHVWVDADWVRSSVAGQVDDGWSEGFDGMLAYAATKGWTDDTGARIKAHIEVVAPG